MTRISIDPAELAALATLYRNASYDAASIALEAQHRCGLVEELLAQAGMTANAAALTASVEGAAESLLRAAAQLDDDALLLAVVGRHDPAVDAAREPLGAGGEQALLSQLREDPPEATN